MADQRVEQHRLAGVGASDERNLEIGIEFRHVGFGRESGDNLAHEVVDADVVVGADGNRVAESEVVEIEDLLFAAHVVGLVDSDDDGLSRPAERRSHVVVGGRQTCTDIRDHDDDIGVFDGNVDLRTHFFPNLRWGGFRPVVSLCEAAGVHENERIFRPYGLRADTIAGCASDIGDDRYRPPCEAIK